MKIVIRGGSGMDNPEMRENSNDVSVTTKYGEPSSHLKIGQIQGVDVVLIARHGR